MQKRFVSIAFWALQASAGPGPQNGQQDGTVTLRPDQVVPLPRQAYPALDYRESQKDEFRLRRGLKGGRPEILKHSSGNRYRRVSWKSMKINWDAPESAVFCWNTIISGGETCYEN